MRPVDGKTRVLVVASLVAVTVGLVACARQDTSPPPGTPAAGAAGTNAATRSGAPPESAGATERFNFDTSLVGSPPEAMQVFSGTWVVRAEPDAPSAPNALCQTGTAEFPALALSARRYQDVVISAKVKAVSGREDQAAGLLARIQDAGNYYIGRANALENNVRLYHYLHGSRQQISGADGVLTAGRWQELRLAVSGTTLRLSLDGKPITQATDKTFVMGRMGLWTKADSTTCFDDITVTAA